MATMDKVTAPFDDNQVRRINAFQKNNKFHPFTCSTDGCKVRVLHAEKTRMICRGCGYVQYWVYSIMAVELPRYE